MPMVPKATSMPLQRRSAASWSSTAQPLGRAAPVVEARRAGPSSGWTSDREHAEQREAQQRPGSAW